MVKDDAQLRHLVGDLHDRLEQIDPRVGGIQDQIRLRQQPKAFDERGASHFLRQVPAPEVAVPDAPEERILVVAAQHLCEVRLPGLEISNHADHDGVRLSHLEHPQVVFHPGARFDFHGADDAERRCQRSIARRQRGLRRSGSRSAGVGRALRARRVEEMDMGVDDRNRCGRLRGQQFGRGPPVRQSARCPDSRGHACDAAEKRPAFEIGRTASIHRPQLYSSAATPTPDFQLQPEGTPPERKHHARKHPLRRRDSTGMIRRASRHIHFQHFADASAGPQSRTGLISVGEIQ